MEKTVLIPTHVATPEQYIKAILKIRDKKMLPDSHIEMLKAQYRAPYFTITATQLAEAAKYPNYNSANLQYGTLACNIADALSYTPEKRPDGTPRCWTTLSYSIEGSYETDTEHFQFIMRPELSEAISTMGWVRQASSSATSE